MSLPSNKRLPLRFERQRIDSAGVPSYSTLFTLVRAESPQGVISPRFAVLVSRKISNLAVTRNRLKRQILNALNHLDSGLPVADYLIIPKRTTLNSTYSQIVADLKKLLKA